MNRENSKPNPQINFTGNQIPKLYRESNPKIIQGIKSQNCTGNHTMKTYGKVWLLLNIDSQEDIVYHRHGYNSE